MSNPIIELQNKQRNSNSNNNLLNNPAIQQLLQLKNQIRTAQNPQQALNEALLKNPRINDALQLIKANGGDARTAFFNYANQMGVNPQDVLNLLR